MSITISDASSTIILPDDLVWRNEFDTSQIAQSQSRTLGGNLVVFESQKIAGRKIALESDADSGWITRNDLDLLRSMFEQVDTDLTLVRNAVSFTVRVDRSSGSGIKVIPVIDCSNPSSTDKYALSVYLITV